MFYFIYLNNGRLLNKYFLHIITLFIYAIFNSFKSTSAFYLLKSFNSSNSIIIMKHTLIDLMENVSLTVDCWTSIA